MNDNISSIAYHHFVSFVKELNRKDFCFFAIPIQEILEKIRYKGKSYSQILNEIFKSGEEKDGKEKKSNA